MGLKKLHFSRSMVTPVPMEKCRVYIPQLFTNMLSTRFYVRKLPNSFLESLHASCISSFLSINPSQSHCAHTQLSAEPSLTTLNTLDQKFISPLSQCSDSERNLTLKTFSLAATRYAFAMNIPVEHPYVYFRYFVSRKYPIGRQIRMHVIPQC
uniref:PAZ domain-containing protein n=1 Tax=Ascaris lumbricoides TaxID=6252 RepID=A0A0M3ICP0_ASCLU